MTPAQERRAQLEAEVEAELAAWADRIAREREVWRRTMERARVGLRPRDRHVLEPIESLMEAALSAWERGVTLTRDWRNQEAEEAILEGRAHYDAALGQLAEALEKHGVPQPADPVVMRA